jgi:hypothetical protein
MQTRQTSSPASHQFSKRMGSRTGETPFNLVALAERARVLWIARESLSERLWSGAPRHYGFRNVLSVKQRVRDTCRDTYRCRHERARARERVASGRRRALIHRHSCQEKFRSPDWVAHRH